MMRIVIIMEMMKIKETMEIMGRGPEGRAPRPPLRGGYVGVVGSTPGRAVWCISDFGAAGATQGAGPL